MTTKASPPSQLALALAGAWGRLERRLSSAVSFRGVSFSEYRLLRTLSDSPDATATRVDLAAAIGVTPSGVTRALQPLEKIRLVKTIRSKRDARLALARLTPAGGELVAQCSAAIDESIAALLDRGPGEAVTLADLVGTLARP